MEDFDIERLNASYSRSVRLATETEHGEAGEERVTGSFQGTLRKHNKEQQNKTWE